jgi:RimJ/RimL family protein N-acetyltransferase
MNTPRFILREWQLSDAASLAENANNIHIWNNMRDGFPYPYSEEDGEQFIGTMQCTFPPATDMAIVIDGEAVGGIGIVLQTDVERIGAEIGYWLSENYWNNGIMTEAVGEMISYVFLHFPELKKVYASVFGFNIASQRVLQKAGFECEGILKQAVIKNGEITDLHYYSMFKSRWISNVHHRFFLAEDFFLLKDLLYEAIFQPEDAEPLPRDIIKKPEIDSAIRDFGKKPDDFCLFAELNGKTAGGAWMRISDGEPQSYGHIDSETPEMVIAVFREYRNLGIGRGLMHRLIDSAFKKYKQISLSVDKRNYAVKMYRELGFEIVRENEQDYVMVLKRNDS